MESLEKIQSVPPTFHEENPIGATHQIQSVPPTKSNRCHPPIARKDRRPGQLGKRRENPIGATHQIQSVPPTKSNRCHPPIAWKDRRPGQLGKRRENPIGGSNYHNRCHPPFTRKNRKPRKYRKDRVKGNWCQFLMEDRLRETSCQNDMRLFADRSDSTPPRTRPHQSGLRLSLPINWSLRHELCNDEGLFRRLNAFLACWVAGDRRPDRLVSSG
jgi:hypothetical protein